MYVGLFCLSVCSFGRTLKPPKASADSKMGVTKQLLLRAACVKYTWTCCIEWWSVRAFFNTISGIKVLNKGALALLKQGIVVSTLRALPEVLTPEP